MRFKTDTRVRFAHIDGAQIAFYPRYFEWFHDAFEDFFEGVFGVSYAEILETRGVGYPAVQVATEFKRPARFGDLVSIEVFISKLSRRSATFEYRVRLDDALLCCASVKVVGMGMQTHAPTEFPDDIYAGFEAHLEPLTEAPDTARLR